MAFIIWLIIKCLIKLALVSFVVKSFKHFGHCCYVLTCFIFTKWKKYISFRCKCSCRNITNSNLNIVIENCLRTFSEDILKKKSVQNQDTNKILCIYFCGIVHLFIMFIFYFQFNLKLIRQEYFFLTHLKMYF